MYDGVMPTNEIKGGIFLLISGLLLITPGFFTDCIGFAVFLKPVQDFISQTLKIILSQELEGINVSICPTKSKSAVTCLLSLGFSMFLKEALIYSILLYYLQQSSMLLINLPVHDDPRTFLMFSIND